MPDWVVVKQLILQSHGQAAVERGFSINWQVDADNITGPTITAHRLVCGYVNAVGGVLNVDSFDKQLVILCSSACQKYFAHLEDGKKKNVIGERSKKCKCVEEEVESLKKKKVAHEKDIESLTTDADNLAVKAEKDLNLSVIMKSDALRCAFKEKNWWTISGHPAVKRQTVGVEELSMK